jgi:hypothetical protein
MSGHASSEPRRKLRVFPPMDGSRNISWGVFFAVVGLALMAPLTIAAIALVAETHQAAPALHLVQHP